ncbi:MAG: HAD-IA family hydrolase [Micropepsaceae bacterium]
MPANSIVVFDVGSTLIHPNFVTLARWLNDRTGHQRSQATVERAFRQAVGRDISKRPLNVDLVEANKFFNACDLPQKIEGDTARRFWAEIIDSGGVNSWLYTTVDPEAEMTLVRVKALGCRVVAASNSDGTLEAELESFNLLRHFDEIFDSSIMGVEKPNEIFYRRVLQSSKALFSIHVGDDLVNDCIAAASAGFHRALLYDPLDLFPGMPPHVKIARLSDVLSVLNAKS